MIFISHRGNLFGPKPELENKPEYIDVALSLGYNVEIDIWAEGDRYYLGHDKPDFKIDVRFLESRSKNIWIHCKNGEALASMIRLGNPLLNFFSHNHDFCALTSKKFIWCYPKHLVESGIYLSFDTPTNLEAYNMKNYNMIGICSDYISDWRNYTWE